MAIGWLAVLRIVPWVEVVRNAPKVADGAKKLWNAIAAKKPSPPVAMGPQAQAASPAPAETLEILRKRVADLEVTAVELHRQLLALSELVKELADQNTQLVARMEANRVRALWLTGATVLVGLLTISMLAWLLVHRGAWR